MTKPTALILLNRQKISFFTPEGVEKAFEIPKTIAENSEIKNVALLSKEIAKFLISENIEPKKAVLLLSNEILFIKEAKNDKQQKTIFKEFLTEIPFKKSMLIHKEYQSGETTKIVATNKLFFMRFVNELTKNGWKIPFILPITAMELTKFSPDIIPGILKNKKMLKQASYSLEEKKIKSGNKKKTVLWVGTIIGIVLVLLGIALTFGYLKNKREQEALIETQRIEQEEKQKALEVQLEEEENRKLEEIVIPQIAKEDIKIQVLNGSGVAGQAGKAQELLETVGFIQIEVGNAETQDYPGTELSFREDLPEEYIQEVADALIEEFETIEENSFKVGEENDNINYDIQIITGQLLGN